MADHAHSTGAPTCALLSRTDFSPAAIMARANAYAAERVAEMAARPAHVDGRTDTEILASIEAEIARQASGVEAEVPPAPLLPIAAPLPSLSTALARRRALFGAMPAESCDTDAASADPIFPAIAELDRAGAALTAVWTAWADGPHPNLDDDTLNGVGAAVAVNDAARDALMATRPTTELGAAAYRAAARRYAGRPTGSRVEADAMLARLGVMLASAA